MQPGPSDGTATVKFVDVGRRTWGFPSPACSPFGLREGMNLKSVFHMGADTFSLAFRKGEGPADIKGIEGKTILLGSAAWQPIVDPMLAAQGVDISTITYVEAGWPTWGTALAGGQGDAALAWGRAAGGVDLDGTRVRILLGCRIRPCPQYLCRAGGRSGRSGQEGLHGAVPEGLGDGHGVRRAQPARAVEAVFEQFPTLGSNLSPELG